MGKPHAPPHWSSSAPAKVIAEDLSVPERIMLFCILFAKEWERAAVAPSLTRQLFVRGLIGRQGATSYTLTDRGRAVLAALLESGKPVDVRRYKVTATRRHGVRPR